MVSEVFYNHVADLRKLNSLNRWIKPFGIGTWSFSGPLKFGEFHIGRADNNLERIEDILDHAIQNGINFIDTADTYGLGSVEAMIGNTIHNKDFILCTKFGNVFKDGKHNQDFSTKYLKLCIEKSIESLGRESIDIMLFHSPPDDYPWCNYDIDVLTSILDTEKVKAFGVSCHSYKGAMNCMLSGFGQVIEVIYNILDRRIENEVLPLAESLNYDVIVKVPLLHGLLQKGYNRNDFKDGDHRQNFTNCEFEWIKFAKKRLSFLDDLPGGIILSALRFSMAPKQVKVVIPGVKKKSHIEMINQAIELGPLDDDIINNIKDSLPETYPGW